MKKLLKKLHKWIGLAIGLQIFLWLLSGVMMAQLDPASVSGERWTSAAQPQAQTRSQTIPQQVFIEPHQLPAEQLNKALDMQLESRLGYPVYRIRYADGEKLFDAVNGDAITFNQQSAGKIAAADFIGHGAIDSIEPGTAPDLETRDSIGPYWRVNFSDKASTSIYISASSGEILERRNNYWRVFDFFWMLHIMDYTGHSNFNNPIIIIIGLIAIWLGLSGFTLLFYSFRRRDFEFLRRAR